MGGQPPKRREGLGVERAAECCERRRDHHRLVDQRRLPLLEPALQPTRGQPPGAPPVAERDEGGQLEGLVELEPAGFARLELGADEVAALDRAAERRSRMALGSRVRTPFLGPERCEPSRSTGCGQSGALLPFCRNRPLLRTGNP